MLFAILVSSTVTMAPAHSIAWNRATHEAIADFLYHRTPSQYKDHLIRSEMVTGSTLPDRWKKDPAKKEYNSYHKYDGSVDKTKHFMIRAEEEFKAGSYAAASRDFGIASHYISDTFAANHYGDCGGKWHLEYYHQANHFRLRIFRDSYKGIDTILKDGFEEAKKSIVKWDKTRSSEITRRNLDDAVSAVSAIYTHFLGQ